MNKNSQQAIPIGLRRSLNLVSYNRAPDHKVANTTSLAYEVRDPLTCIILSAEMIQSLTRNKELQPYLDIIMRGTARINHLTNELLKCQAIPLPTTIPSPVSTRPPSNARRSPGTATRSLSRLGQIPPLSD